MRGEVEDSALLGNRALLEQYKIDPGELAAKAEELRIEGQTVMFVAIDGRAADCRRRRSDQNHDA